MLNERLGKVMATNLWTGIADDTGIESFLLLKDHLGDISTLQLRARYNGQRNAICFLAHLETNQSAEIIKSLSCDEHMQALEQLKAYAGPLIEF